jgi:hypothetical protein
MVGRDHEESVKESGAAVGLALAAGCCRQPSGADPPPGVRAERSSGAVGEADGFLCFMIDRYPNGAAIRLVQERGQTAILMAESRRIVATCFRSATA